MSSYVCVRVFVYTGVGQLALKVRWFTFHPKSAFLANIHHSFEWRLTLSLQEDRLTGCSLYSIDCEFERITFISSGRVSYTDDQ